MKKYKLTNDSIIFNDKKLYRIESLCKFSNVKIGEVGGYIESEKNLSQEGVCWLFNDAKVYDNAYIHGNARVYDSVIVCGNGIVSGYGRVYGDSIVTKNALNIFNSILCEYNVTFINDSIQIGINKINYNELFNLNETQKKELGINDFNLFKTLTKHYYKQEQ